MKTGGVYLGFHTLRGRKFPYGNFRTSVFCEVKTQIVGKTKFFDSLSTEEKTSVLFCAKSVAAVLFAALFRAERKPSGLFGLTACAAAFAFFEPVLLTRKL